MMGHIGHGSYSPFSSVPDVVSGALILQKASGPDWGPPFRGSGPRACGEARLLEPLEQPVVCFDELI